MKIGLVFPSVFGSPSLFKDKIFAPRDLFLDLEKGLVQRGHEVTVFGAEDLETAGRLVPTSLSYLKHPPAYHKFHGLPEVRQEILQEEYVKRQFELATIAHAYSYAGQGNVDLLHVYHDSSLFLSHYFEESHTDIPVVYSLHDPLPPVGSFEHKELLSFVHHKYLSISMAQRNVRELPLTFVDNIYHGIDLSRYDFDPEPSDYLLFMGRMVPEKGLHSAIKVALAVNMQLEIGSNLPRTDGENPYFDREIRPFIDNPLIGEPGIVVGEDKSLLTRKARALLFPIEWEEPFGMVLIEAMACGVPVIAYNRGSVPEIVRDGVTGFIVNENDSYHGDWTIKKTGIEGLVEAVNRLGEIDRSACRHHVEEYFSTEKMVEGYEKVYSKSLL